MDTPVGGAAALMAFSLSLMAFDAGATRLLELAYQEDAAGACIGRIRRSFVLPAGRASGWIITESGCVL